jgi:deazaflavin-dependent oxidoreductase (nitroreductase family)
VVITSVGASTRRLRKHPVMRVEQDGVYAAVASKGGAPNNPAWYWNLVEHPLVELQDEGAKGDYTARELSGDERERWWVRALEVWPDYAQYQTKTDRMIPVFLLEPVD